MHVSATRREPAAVPELPPPELIDEPMVSPELRRTRLTQWRNINLVVDVGASSGQFARRLRGAGYSGRIVSIEPTASPFRLLQDAVRQDPLWECHRTALGAQPGVAEMQITRDSVSSSLLKPTRRHVSVTPGAKPVGTETIAVTTLDALCDRIMHAQDCVYVKKSTYRGRKWRC
jgi:FkbM family methyltransferase